MPTVNHESIARRAKLVTITAIALLIVACSSYPNKPFNLMDEQRQVKATSVAVIAGTPDEGTKKLIELVTNRLTEKSNFHVLSQEQIGRLVPNYPTPIQIRSDEELNKETNNEKTIWFPASEKAKLNALQKRLKVDYLYVLWNPWLEAYSYQGKTTYYVYPSGNMIEYPSGKVVASTKMSRGESDSILALFRPKDYYIVKAFEDSADDIVDEMIKVTNSARKK